MLRKLFYYYQQACFYANIAVNESRKPLVLLNEALLITTALAVHSIKVGFWLTVIAYLIVMVCGVVIGRVIIKARILAMNNTFNNQQNDELQEILTVLKRVEANTKK